MKRIICLILVFVMLFTTNSQYVFTDGEPIDTYMEDVLFDAEWLTPDIIFGEGNYEVTGEEGYYYDMVYILNLPNEGERGSSIEWSTTDESLITIDEGIGTINRPSYLEGWKEFILTATLTKGEAGEKVTQEKLFEILVDQLDPNEYEKNVQDDYNWLSNNRDIYGDNTGYAEDIRFNLNLLKKGEHGSDISWASSDERWIQSDGTVIQPPFSFAMGNAAVKLTATITSGSALKQMTFELEVIAEFPTSEELVAIDKDWLKDDIILKGNSIDNVKTRLYLPKSGVLTFTPSGYYGMSTIEWQSSNQDVISNDGSVIRPSKGEDNVNVTLIATISYGDIVDTKEFDFVVTSTEEFPLAINYNDFGDTSRLNFNGISGTTGTALSFDNMISSGGSIFTKNKIRLGEDLSFSAAFSYRNPHPDFTTGAGGFVFILQSLSDSIFPESLNDESIKPSLNIGFITDYYKGSGGGQASSYNYTENVTVYYNGDYSKRTEARRLKNKATNDPPSHNNVWIEYDGSSKVLEIRFSTDGLRPFESNYKIEDLELGDILASAGDGLNIEDVSDVYVGFMGSLGDAKDKSEIHSLYFKNDSTPIDHGPYNFTDMSNINISADPEVGQASSTITVEVMDDGPVEGVPISFYTSLGSLDSDSAITDHGGKVTTQLSSTASGTAIVKAMAPGGAMGEIQVQLSVSDEDSLDFDYEWLTEEIILGDNSELNNIISNLNLPPEGPSGSTINWESSDPSLVDSNGIVTRPSLEQENEITLTARLSMGEESLDKIFNIILKVLDEDLAAADKEWLTNDIILKENTSLDEINSNLNLPTTGDNGSIISWVSSNEEIVDEDGKVNQPRFTQGNQLVTLTARIQMGEVILNKEFNIRVIASSMTDEDIANKDYLWLTEEIILNGNEGLKFVSSNLTLPNEGPNGSIITWESTNEDFVKIDGTIIQPTRSQGNQEITLTAKIVKGSSEYSELFYIIIVPLLTDAEVVIDDIDWLISTVFKYTNIEDNLDLPTTGDNGSTISWSSSNEDIIKADGTVNRPEPRQGNKIVILTARVEKGSESATVDINFLVNALERTDKEDVEAFLAKLRSGGIFGENLSKNSITKDLQLYESGYNGVLISWESDKPLVISTSGKVKRPEYGQGHEKVKLTATLSKGVIEISEIFEYIVLSKLDTFPPEIKETIPSDKSANVPWDINEITITFDENIKIITEVNNIENYGITLYGPGLVDFSVSVSKNILTVNLVDYLEPRGNYELVVPSNTITDDSDNNFSGEIKISFNLEEKLDRKIRIVESSPSNNEKEVSCELDQIALIYNYSDIRDESKFEDIVLLDMMGNEMDISRAIVGNNITLTLADKNLQPSSVYEVSIPSGVFTDRFENSSIKESIKFRTKSSDRVVSIIDYYPRNGQTNVATDQFIKIKFSEAISLKDCNLVLLDDKDKEIKSRLSLVEATRNIVTIRSHFPYDIKPMTKYTVKGNYNNSVDDSVGFEMSFTTGDNSPGFFTGFTSYFMELPVKSPIKISFPMKVSEGSNFEDIKMLDSSKSEVDHIKKVVNNEIVITPNGPLNPSECYEFQIPKGAVISETSKENDSLVAWRIAASPIDYGNATFYMGSAKVKGQPFYFDANWIKQLSRPLKYIKWDFENDHEVEDNLFPYTVFGRAMDYNVTLTLIDDKDFTYIFKETININNVDLSNAEILVNSNDTQFTVYEENNPYGIKNSEIFSISLYSHSIGYVSGEKINVKLYKNGDLVEDLGSVKTGYDGQVEFLFKYGNKGYFGNYELVFNHDGMENKRTRLPIYFKEATSKQNMAIILYDEFTGGNIKDKGNKYFDINGVKKLGIYDETYRGMDTYLIEGMETGIRYSVKLSNLGDEAYITDEQSLNHQGSDYPVYLWARLKEIGAFHVKSALTDSKARGLSTLFIKNISIPNLYFEFIGDWGGLTPGYYELKSSLGSIHMISDKPIFELQPGLQMQAGEELWGRMVSKSGLSTLWWDTYVTVAPYPTLEYGPKLDVRYANGEYLVDTILDISGLTGGKIDILDGIPLLDIGSFGMGNSKGLFNGTISGQGDLRLSHESGLGIDGKVKKSKVLNTGYEIEANNRFYGRLYFDKNGGNDWKLVYYRYHFNGSGKYYWKRPYGIPKIDIGGWGKLTLGANVNGKLAIEGNDKTANEFKGILEFVPFVSVGIGAGFEGALSVEGSVTGSIPAEFHIPTGYIQVEPNINAKIEVYYIFDHDTVYFKEIVRTHWDNNKDKVILFSQGFMEEQVEEIELRPSLRNYLDRDSEWLPESNSQMENRMTTFGDQGTINLNSKSQTEVLVENIYPRAEVELVSVGNEQWLVWTEDNPERDENNRTQLKYSVYRDGSWIDPEWVGDDQTADFSPTMAISGNDLLLAWQNIKEPMLEETKHSSFIKDSEISVTNGSITEIVNLTNDDKFDHSPVIAADNEKAILVWTKSEGLGISLGEGMDGLQASSDSDSLYSSIWDGSTWSTPEKIEVSMPTILDSSLVMYGEEAMLLYTLDKDNNQSTQDDREVYYRIYNGSDWGEPSLISENNGGASSAKATNIDGEWFIIWEENGDIMYKVGLEGERETDEFLSSVSNDYKVVVLEGENPQLTLVYTNANLNNSTSLCASFYDISKGIWSEVIILGESEGHIRSFSPTFTSDGKLNVAYTEAEVIKQVVEEGEFLLPSNKVYLKILSYTPVHDLGLDEESSLILTPSIPVKGTLSKVSVIVKNLGDFAEMATVYLYDGKPSNGKLIGKTTTVEAIAAGSMELLEIEWLVGLEDASEYSLYASVKLDEGLDDVNLDNNTLSLEIATADIAVTGVESENVQGDNYLVKGRIANLGGKTVKDVTLDLVHETSGDIIETRAIDEMKVGQKIDINLFFSSKNLVKDDDGEIGMYLRVTPTDIEKEYSTENNTYRFALEPASITIQSINPLPNERQVNIDKPLTISFNMNVEPGSEFEDIEIIDDELNNIDIDKTLEGSVLTIKPRNPMSYGRKYTLILPDQAVKDSYGHRMDESYNLSFVTTLSSPEIIFAYPGKNMIDVALNSQIKLKFNQEIMFGPTFKDINIHTLDNEKIPLSTSIDGEWMYISLAEGLRKNTQYSLKVPLGGLQNANEEILLDEYILNFKTGGQVGEPKGPEGIEDLGNSHSSRTDPSPDQEKYKISTDGKDNTIVDITKEEMSKTPFAISIPYTPKGEEVSNPECIIISYLDDDGKLNVLLDGYYNSDTGTVNFNVTKSSRFVVSYNKVNFNDISSGDWYGKAVKFIAARGITRGTGNGNYSPQSKLKRSDFIVLLMRSYDIELDEDPRDNFADGGNTYYTNYLATAKNMGITIGIGDNLFAPEKEITRQEMFVLLYNTLKIIDKLPDKTSLKTLSDFTDREMSNSWAEEALTALIEGGIVNGSDGKLLPRGTATRAEMAQILYNLLSK